MPLNSKEILTPAEVTLAIVAGGRALRLGGAVKGLLVVGGERCIDRVARLAPLAHEVVLNVNDAAQFPELAFRRVADVEPGRGAPGGVVSCLLAAATPWVLVVAADMPFLTAEGVRPLLVASDGADVVAFERDGRLEPLCALYRASLGAPWRARLPQNPSLQDLMASVRCTAVAAPSPHLLDSLNTPQDLARHGVGR
jgi:molybdopterin-guanine dinucleotide biosynthesis protein A